MIIIYVIGSDYMKDFKLKWYNFLGFFRSGLAKDIVLGYRKSSGEPDKCPHCKCKDLETYETFRHDQGFVEEYWVRCSKCKEHVGTWAYGSWML